MRLNTWLPPVLFCSFALSEATALASQTAGQESTNRAGWVTAGVGLGTHGFAGALDASYQRGANLFSLRFAGLVPIEGSGFIDYGLMYGRATRLRRIHAGISIGLGIARECEVECFVTVGAIPIAARVAARGRVLGIGLYLFGDLNAQQSFAGLVLALNIGKHY